MKFITVLFFAASIIFISCEKDSAPANCPTTSKCGCSSYSKSECGSKSCCKWTTGQSCGCK